MDDLELCKKFAELEGVDVEVSDMLGTITIGVNGYEVYNPITDLALNCAARDKYGVEIVYKTECTKARVGVWRGLEWVSIVPNSSEDIPKLVIECILKSKGLI